MRPEVVEAAAGAGREADRQRGYRHPRRRGGAARQRAGHRRDRHRSSPAGERTCRPRWRCSIPIARIARTRRRTCAARAWPSSWSQALLAALGWPAEKLRRVAESFLKLVAIATVADVVPLTGENRIIVKHGLSGLRTVRNPGLRALLDVAGFTGGTRAQRAPGGLPDRAAHERRRAHGHRQGGDRAVPHERPGARPRRWPNNCTIRTPSGSRWKRRSREICEQHRGGPRRRRRWSTTPRTGIAACWASWPAAWWSACTGRCSCSAAIPRMGWRRARGAASRRSICWKRWNRCPTSSCDSAATSTPPG